jgi:restriction endonuclease S subunit
MSNNFLINIIQEYVSGDWGNEKQTENEQFAVSCIRGADIVPIENSNYKNIPIRYVSKRVIETKLLREGDIIIEKSGGSPTQSTGRVLYISKELIRSKKNIICSNFCVALRIKDDFNSKYIYYYFKHIYNCGAFFNFEGKTSGLKNLQLESALNSISIKSIPLNKQITIATCLTHIEEKIAINHSLNHNLPFVFQKFEY